MGGAPVTQSLLANQVLHFDLPFISGARLCMGQDGGLSLLQSGLQFFCVLFSECCFSC